MAIDLKSLSPKELQALIANANAQMKEAHGSMIQDVRKKIDALLNLSGLTMAEVYPTRGGKKAAGKKGTRSVAPKYRNPANASETWSGRGRQPVWFATAIKKRGVTAESLLIGGTPKAASTKKAAKPKA
jgi:DNA-binding protein H-NS